MAKSFFLLAISLLFLSASSQAAVYKGQKVYMKKCRKCHKNVQRMTVSKDQYDWKKLMSSNGRGLADLHLADPEAKKSWTYYESSKYMLDCKHLRDFLVEYAKDSGNVPVAH